MLDVDAHPLVDAKLDIRQGDGLEAGHLRRDRVMAGLEPRGRVVTVGIRRHDPGEPGALVDERDFRIGHHRTGGVRDCASIVPLTDCAAADAARA